MRPVKLYAKPYYGEHPVPPPYRIWQHRAWIDASGVVVAEEVDAGDATVSSPYPGVIQNPVMGLKPAQLVKLGFQEVTDPLYVMMRAELEEEEPDEVKLEMPEANGDNQQMAVVISVLREVLWMLYNHEANPVRAMELIELLDGSKTSVGDTP